MDEIQAVSSGLPKRLKFEKEFLKLAGAWMVCRYEVMTGHCCLKGHTFSIDGALLGMIDYQAEMKLYAKQFLDLALVKHVE